MYSARFTKLHLARDIYCFFSFSHFWLRFVVGLRFRFVLFTFRVGVYCMASDFLVWYISRWRLNQIYEITFTEGFYQNPMTNFWRFISNVNTVLPSYYLAIVTVVIVYRRCRCSIHSLPLSPSLCLTVGRTLKC